MCTGLRLGWRTGQSLPGRQSRSHQVPPPHTAGPRVGARKGWRFPTLLRIGAKPCTLSQSLYFADNLRGTHNSPLKLSFCWRLPLSGLPDVVAAGECPQRAHDRNLGEAARCLIKTFRRKPKFRGLAPPPALSTGSQSPELGRGRGGGVCKGQVI